MGLGPIGAVWSPEMDDIRSDFGGPIGPKNHVGVDPPVRSDGPGRSTVWPALWGSIGPDTLHWPTVFFVVTWEGPSQPPDALISVSQNMIWGVQTASSLGEAHQLRRASSPPPQLTGCQREEAVWTRNQDLRNTSKWVELLPGALL